MNVGNNNDAGKEPLDNADEPADFSSSWKFYDTVNQQENIYDNVGAIRSSISDESCVQAAAEVNENVLIPAVVNSLPTANTSSGESHCNSVYENHDIVFMRPKSSVCLNAQTTKSVLMQFDPLNSGKKPKLGK